MSDDQFEQECREIIVIDPNEQLMFMWAACTTNVAFKSEMTFWDMLKRADSFQSNPLWHDFFYLQPNLFTQLLYFDESSQRRKFNTFVLTTCIQHNFPFL